MGWSGPIFVASLTVSGWLLYRLRRRPARIGYRPHCRACGYDLTANQSGRCPECGLEAAPGNVIHGTPPRRPFLLAATLAALAVTACSGVIGLRSINWYTYRPAGWVIDDLKSGDPLRAVRAWNELTRRRAAGRLSAESEYDLTQAALSVHTKPPGTGGGAETQLVMYLFDRHRAGQLDQNQLDRLYRQEMKRIIDIPLKVKPGERVPLQIQYAFRTGGGTYVLRNVTATLGGRTFTPTWIDGAYWVSAPLAPGSYELRVTFDVIADLRPRPRLPAGWEHWRSEGLTVAIDVIQAK